MTTNDLKTITTLSLAMSCSALVASAGEPDFVTPLGSTPGRAAGAWEFTVAPYGLLAGIDGDVTVGPLSADIEQDFGDILENLDAAFIIGAQARYNRFSLQADFIYLGVSADADPGVRLYDKADVELDSIIFTALAAYKVWESDQGFLELGGGARLYHSDVDVELRDNDGIAPTLRGSSDVDIWDGIVAARILYQIAPGWSLRLYGDIGAGDSDLTWQIWANVGYELSDSMTLLAGYRYLAYELEKGRTSMDLSFSGPQVGVAISF